MANVTIVGGGLAGMIAGLKLSDSDRNCKVTLFEGNNRLGGKAGSDCVEGRYEDHGFHIFPMWYLNTWRIVRELDIEHYFIDVEYLNQIRVGEFPDFKRLKNMASLRAFPRNLFSGVLPLADMFLFYYTGLDLLSHKYSQGYYLDEISFSGFIWSRFYADEEAVNQFQNLLIKVASAPTYRFSTITMQKLLQSWVVYHTPTYRIPTGSLHETFIYPIQAQMQKQGCDIYLNHKLEGLVHEICDGKPRVTHIHLRDTQTGELLTQEVEYLVLALQPIDILPLLDDSIYEATPELFNIEYLDAQPMSALSIHCKTRIPNIPSEHVTLTDSRYQLSFIDISQVWTDLKDGDKTVLNVVASDYLLLKQVSPELAIRSILEELRRYIPYGLEDENIENVYMQPHLKEPLFMNYVASWPYRPDSTQPTGFSNLFLAGDYCKTNVDLATMESAVSSGLNAAEGVRKVAGIDKPVQVDDIPTPRRSLMFIAKYVTLPIAVVAKIWTTLFNRRDS